MSKINGIKQNTIFILLAVLIIFFTAIHVKRIVQANSIKKNYKVTKGKLLNFYNVGIENNTYARYFYIVGGKRFERKLNTGAELPMCCKKPTQKCCDNKYWVIYSLDNPEKSLIDFTREIQGVDSQEFLGSLENFE